MRELEGENARLREATESRYEMVGASPALQQVRELIDKVGPTAARVLITGENGTGKELVARALHEASPRREGAFVEVNCAAIPSELIESELFGHMKGSFTGAFADRAGKFEQADGGTLFLDEVGDMSLPAQAKLLRVLQEGVVTRIGGSKADPGGRARARGDQQGSRDGDRRRTVPRGSAVPAQRRADRGARAPRAGRRHPRAGGTLRRAAGGRARECRDGSSRTMRSDGCNRDPGPGTSASSATRWSGRSFWRPGRS